jgi:hypothetical protein
MTQTQAVKLTTRIMSAFLIYNAATFLFSMIRALLLISGGIFTTLDGVRLSRMERHLIYESVVDIVQFVLCVVFAILLYRGGPKMIRFFIEDSGDKGLQPTEQADAID